MADGDLKTAYDRWRIAATSVEGRQRAGKWALPVLAAALIAIGAVTVWSESHQPGSFHVGVCFNTTADTGVQPAGGLREVTGRAVVVDCAAAHDGEITRTARRSADCAAEGAWLDSRDQIYCVRLG